VRLAEKKMGPVGEEIWAILVSSNWNVRVWEQGKGRGSCLHRGEKKTKWGEKTRDT